MSDETTLLPCPFCGGEAKVIQADYPSYTPHGEGWYVICKCGTTLGYHGTDELYMTYGDFASKLEAIAAWNTRAHGTLTAEQVREAIERHVKFYEGGDYDEQAIADELNAELGSGTCHSTTDDSAWCFACSECGKSFPRNKLHLAHNHGEINFCPNCGRRAVER